MDIAEATAQNAIDSFRPTPIPMMRPAGMMKNNQDLSLSSVLYLLPFMIKSKAQRTKSAVKLSFMVVPSSDK